MIPINRHERCAHCGEGHLAGCPSHEAAQQQHKTSTYQQVLTMSTYAPHGGVGIRAEAFGWSADDPGQMPASEVGGQHDRIGLVGGYWKGWYSYASPLHAMADGWYLLGSPTEEKDGTLSWWFVREAERSNVE